MEPEGTVFYRTFVLNFRSTTLATYLKGCNFFVFFFPFFFGVVFPVFWGLMVLIGICSVLQLSSLICMVLLLLLWLDGWMDGWLVGWLVS